MPKKQKIDKKEGKNTKDEERLHAFLCYLISIVGVLIVLATKSERKEYSLYHARQGFVLFIGCVVVAIIASILSHLAVMGWIINTILWALVVILWIIGMINALTDKKVPLPIIGYLGEKFKF